MSDAAHHLKTLQRLLLPASRRVPVDTAEYQRALAYAIRAIEERDELLIACKAFVDAYEKCLQLEKTDVALRLCRIAIKKTERTNT